MNKRTNSYPAAALVWRGRPSVPATSRSEKDRSCRFQNRPRDHAPSSLARSLFPSTARHFRRHCDVHGLSPVAEISKVLSISRLFGRSRVQKRAFLDRTRLEIIAHRERERIWRDKTHALSRSFSRTIREWWCVWNRTGPVHSTMILLQPVSAENDTARSFCFMNESCRFVYLRVRLSVSRKNRSVRISQPWHWIIVAVVSRRERSEKM